MRKSVVDGGIRAAVLAAGAVLLRRGGQLRVFRRGLVGAPVGSLLPLLVRCPWPELLPLGVVERHHRGGGANVQRGDQDGRDDADEEPGVVPLADALIEPLAVVVEGVHALVAGGAVLGALAGDGDVTEVTVAVLNDVGMPAKEK